MKLKIFLLVLLALTYSNFSNAQSVSITSSATNNTISSGSSVTFTATATGYTTPTYQWYKNNVAISGETNSTYVTTVLINNDAIKVAVVEGSSSVTTNGLVMNLDAGNASSYSGTGNTWTDLTGRGNNGTIPSAIVYNSANGGYFQFANSIGVVLPSASPDFNLGTSDFTIELWVNPNANGHRLLSINGRSSTNSAAFQIIGGASGYLYSNYGTVSSGFTWGAWHHVVISRISTTCSTYVDGVLKGTTTDASSLGSNIVGSDAASTTSNTLGSFYSTSSYLSYQGKMSIARVYKDVGLTSSQVIQNYNSIRSRYGLSSIVTTSNTITTTVNNSIILTSATDTNAQTIANNDTLTNITYTTTGATGATFSGLPTGVTGSWSNNSITISGTPTIAGIYNYTVTLTGGNGTVTATGTITVKEVTITSNISGSSICAGISVTFSATTTAITSPTYQWYKNGTAISGANASTYTTSTLSNNDQISVQATPGYTVGSTSTTGLIANFDAANYISTSTRWNDLSSSANHMDFYTDRTYSTLKTATYSTEGGGSLNVNNNSVFGKTISNTGISGNGGKTMSAWIKFDAKDVTWSSIASIGEYAALKVFEMYVQVYPNSQLLFHWSGGQLQYNSDLAQNTWYYVTIKSDGSSGNYIYINGIQVAYATQTLNITNSPLYLGAPKTNSQGGWDYNLRGKISTLSLYNTALSAQTILDNYNATKGRYTSTSITSNTITLSITAGPTLSLILTGDACVNKSSLSATTGLSSYAWYKDDAMISGATTNTYTPSVAGAYKVNASNGTCSTTSSATTINTCGVTSDGKMISTTFSAPLVSSEGGANFGTTMDEVGKILNTTGLTTTTGTIAATTAVLGGIISATNAVTSSIGVIYSTDANFGTYSSSTIQSNVAAGTYTTTITGLTSETTYYSKSFIVNKAGTSYGPVVSFTTPVRPIAVGDSYRGGIVVYIAGPSDPGYDANTTHGLIAAKVDLGKWAWNNGSSANTTNNYFGAGIGNTATIVAQSGTNGGVNYAAKVCDDYTVTETVGGITTTYNDWYLGSTYELQKMMQNSSYLTGSNSLTSNYYWASNEQTATGPAASGIAIGSALYVRPDSYIDQWGRTGAGTINVRAIRKF